MLHYWYEDMVRFMKDASEYGTYNRELVTRMAPLGNVSVEQVIPGIFLHVPHCSHFRIHFC